MYCEKCGNKLDDDSKFCDKCGTVIETTDNIKKSKDNVFNKFILPLILVTLFIILIFIGANLILNKHNEKSEEYKQEINEELDKKVIATYNGPLGIKRILSFASISIEVLGVKNLAGDSELIKQFRFPLLAQRSRTNNQNLFLSCSPVLANDQACLNSFSQTNLIGKNDALRKWRCKSK